MCASRGRRPVHWFFRRSDGQWTPYSAEDSDRIEGACQEESVEIPLAGGGYSVRVQEREQRRLDNDTRRAVLRGTWFFQRSDGRMQPYTEDLAAALQQTFAPALAAWEAGNNDGETQGLSVETGEDRKVMYIGSGRFVQVRGDQTLGRMVSCGFDPDGALPQEKSSQELLVVVPLEVRAPRANPIRDIAKGYVDGYSEGAEAARTMTGWIDGNAQGAGPALERIAQAAHAPSSSQAMVPAAGGMTSDARNQLKRYAGLGEGDDLGALRPQNPAELPLVGRGRWFWARNERDIQPFPDEASAVTEVAAMRGVQVLQVQLDSREMTCLVQARKVVDQARDRVYPLLRATWFFQRNNSSLEPYDEALALSLERAFFGACTDESGRARTEESMSWHTKHYGLFEVGQERVVCARRGGGFCQVREENKTARLVVRGFREQAHAHEQPPHEPFCGWDNWGDTRDSPEKREAAAGYRRQVGQRGLDEMSMFGLQTVSGAAVDEGTRGTAEGTGRSFLFKRETDEQLVRLRETREATAKSLQVAQRDAADSMAALKLGMEAMTQQTLDRFADIGESLPAGITPVGKPTMQLIGQVVGFTSVIGSWIVGGVSTAVDAGLGAAEKTVDAGIRGGESALSGVQTVMSAAQTEFVLGVEGAAIMENMINLHEAEFKQEYSDIGYMQLARGISAYSSLQQLSRPDYIHAGVVDKCGPGLPGDERQISADRQTLALWLRYMRLSSCAYGVAFMTTTGVTDAKNLFLGNERTVYERTGIPPDKIIHAVWEAEGYAQPGWILVQDDQTHAVCLVISGSKSNSDWLSNLRCANVDISQDHYGSLPVDRDHSKPVSCHAGIWAAAVKMDERCLAIVTKALEARPGWPLVICGHSLGAGTGSLLGMRWRGKGLFPGFKVYAYATPPTVDCPKIVEDSLDYITSFQCSDDFVTRWCLGTTLDIAKAGHALATGEEGVVDKLIDVSLYGFETPDGTRDTQGRQTFTGHKESQDDYASQVRRKNKALFTALLKEQQAAGTLPSYAVDPDKPYILPINMTPVADRPWVDGLLRACEERMDADKLIPLGKCHWMIPILQDQKTFKSRRATWSEIADGGTKCQVTMLNPRNDMFTRMPVNDHVVSDHCPAPYERCLEALLLQAGGAVPDPEGWVAFFQERRRTGLAARNSYDIEKGGN